MATTNIKRALKKFAFTQEELPEVLVQSIEELDTKYNAWDADFKKYSKNPDDFSDEQIQGMREAETAYLALEADIVGQIEQHRADVNANEAEKKAKADQEAADKAKADQEAADKAKADQEAAEKAKQDEEEAERQRLAKQSESSGSLGKGLLVGGVLFVLTLGAINLFKNK